jgi:hypothetical protein
MTASLRLFMLNTQISLAAREIAHAHTDTCKGNVQPNHNDNHTPGCNQLKRRIEELGLAIKLAGLQPPVQKRGQRHG